MLGHCKDPHKGKSASERPQSVSAHMELKGRGSGGRDCLGEQVPPLPQHLAFHPNQRLVGGLELGMCHAQPPLSW